MEKIIDYTCNARVTVPSCLSLPPISILKYLSSNHHVEEHMTMMMVLMGVVGLFVMIMMAMTMMMMMTTMTSEKRIGNENGSV